MTSSNLDTEILRTSLVGDIPETLAASAFQGVSFDPEGRGRRSVADYANTLVGIRQQLETNATKGGTLANVPEQFERLREGARRRFIAYLSSSSRCISSFIAGPSNFPVRRAEKRSDVAHARLGEYLSFLRRAQEAANRNLRPDLRPIMSGDVDAVDRLKEEIARAEEVQARMKAANVAIRKHRSAGAEHQIAALMEMGFSESRAAELLKPDCLRRVGFPDYALTNNSASIRRLKARLAHLEVAKASPVATVEGSSAKLEDDPPANRVRLIFPGKPDVSVRDRLKRGGFRWAPSTGAWQAYRNDRSLALAREIAA